MLQPRARLVSTPEAVRRGHGPLLLAHDFEALVLDPCFRDTDVQQAAEQLPCPLEWHHGFRLSVDELQRHPDYRGAQYIELGISMTQDGYLDPKMLGDASATGTHDDQDPKRLWHHIARFGSLADAFPAPSKPSPHPGSDPSEESKQQDGLNLAQFLDPVPQPDR